MATVVTVMDRDGFDQRTDNIVVVQPRRHRLLWVPRDVWCPALGDRINVAFQQGSHAALIAALRSLGLDVDHSLCLSRGSVERALADVRVTVPVEEALRLWYPLGPSLRIEDGRKPVDFLPPSEDLWGERVHQWLGARYARTEGSPSSDLDRIRRQQVFLRALLRQGFDFGAVLHDPEPPLVSDPTALADLRRVRRSWGLRTTDQVVDRVEDARRVLDLRSPEPKPPRWRRGLHRLRPGTRPSTRPGTRHGRPEDGWLEG